MLFLYLLLNICTLGIFLCLILRDDFLSVVSESTFLYLQGIPDQNKHLIPKKGPDAYPAVPP